MYWVQSFVHQNKNSGIYITRRNILKSSPASLYPHRGAVFTHHQFFINKKPIRNLSLYSIRINIRVQNEIINTFSNWSCFCQ